MENYAKRLAIEQVVSGKVSKRHYPILMLRMDFEQIRKAYEILMESVSLNIPLPPSGEWILDNFYIIEEQVSIIKEELLYAQYQKLPAIQGKARVEVLASSMVEFTDGKVTQEVIEKFMLAYESKRKMAMEEIWLLPVMLKIALIHHLRIVADRIILSQYQKFKVASLVERVIKNKSTKEQLFYRYKSIPLNGEITAYVEFLVYLLKKEGKPAKRFMDILIEEVQKAGTTLDEMIQTEHYDMALRRVSASNCITSIKTVLRLDWGKIFETINGIENLLLEDEWYQKSDDSTKNLYRNEIQKISKKAKLSETYVASSAIEIAQKEGSHIGEYLLGESKASFCHSLGMEYR